MEPQRPARVPSGRTCQQRVVKLFDRCCSWAREFFAIGKVIGDVRSAVVGSIVAAITTYLLATLTPGPPLHFEVKVNSDGYGQPLGLFSTAEREDPKLKLTFKPEGLRQAFVCEFKQVTGAKWKDLVLSYLDTYRECFDVSAQGDDNYTIFPNRRSARMTLREGAYFCKCDSEASARQ